MCGNGEAGLVTGLVGGIYPNSCKYLPFPGTIFRCGVLQVLSRLQNIISKTVYQVVFICNILLLKPVGDLKLIYFPNMGIFCSFLARF